MYIKESPYLCGTKTETMEVKKKLGRPKGKDKPAGAEWLFHEWLTAEDKETLEVFRLICRVQAYSAKIHGPTPTALPKVTNKQLLRRLVLTSYHAYRNICEPTDLADYLRTWGCLNAAELLGIEEGASE
jgi:hypothetical protein